MAMMHATVYEASTSGTAPLGLPRPVFNAFLIHVRWPQRWFALPRRNFNFVVNNTALHYQHGDYDPGRLYDSKRQAQPLGATLR